MKKILVLLMIVAVNFVLPDISAAQMGWQWGIGGRGTVGTDVLQMTTDRWGSVFAAGSVTDTLPGYTVAGADTIMYVANTYQLTITKADSAGNFLWTIGTQGDQIFCSSLITDQAGNLYVTGNYTGAFSIDTFNFTSTSIWYTLFLAKISPSGTVLWVKNIVNDGDFPDGNLGVDNSGYVYLSGFFLSSTLTIGTTTFTNVDAPAGDGFLAKFDPNGNPVWAKHYGTTGTETPSTLSVTGAGTSYVSGYMDGDTLNMGGINVIGDTAMNSDPAANGNNFFAKFDSSGNVIWAQYLSYHLSLNATAIGTNEDLYVTGTTDTSFMLGSTPVTSVGGSDIMLAKFDSSGHLIWVRTAGGIANENAYGLGVDNCGKIWICARPVTLDAPVTGYNVYFGTSTLFFPYDTVAWEPMFMAEYDSSGNYVSSLMLPSGGDDYMGTAIDNLGNFYLCGDYVTGVTMHFGADSFAINYPEVDEALFIAKYKYDTVACKCTGTSVIPDYTYTGITTVSFTYTGTPAYDSLRWFFGDGATSTAVDPVHTYTAPGIYSACVDVYSTCLPPDKPYLDHCRNIAVRESVANINKADQISIYPNPATNELILESGEIIEEIDVANAVGQAVVKQKCNTGHVQLNVAALAPGLYFIRVNGSIVKKFVKE